MATPKPIPLRLPDTAQGEMAFGRDELEELHVHFGGLSINQIVQMALRRLHREVLPAKYGRDGTTSGK